MKLQLKVASTIILFGLIYIYLYVRLKLPLSSSSGNLKSRIIESFKNISIGIKKIFNYLSLFSILYFYGRFYRLVQ